MMEKTEKNVVQLLTPRDVDQMRAYYEGIKQGLSIYAWRDGEDLVVGVSGTKLKDALAMIDAMRDAALPQPPAAAEDGK